MHLDYPITLFAALVTTALASAYFRTYGISRPPVGVVNLRDVSILLVGIVAIPYLYLVLPLAVVATVLAVAIVGVMLFTAEPVLPRPLRVGIALGTVAADVGLALALGTESNAFMAVNNVVLAIGVVGIANLWAQSGMRAGHVATMALALAVYDLIATSGLPLMADLLERLGGMPLVPFMGWRAGGDELVIGFGDLLLLGLFPLTVRKAFGRQAWAVTLAVTSLALALLLAAVEFGLLGRIVPAMVVLGPLMSALYVAWRRRHGDERTTWQYLRAEAAPRLAAAQS